MDYKIDLLNLYKGSPISITDNIKVQIPTLEEIRIFGELKYYSCVQNICSMPIDFAWQLNEIGVDFSELNEYEFFITTIAPTISKETSSLLFGQELNFSEMELKINKKNNESILVQHVERKKEEYANISCFKKKLYILLHRPLPTTETVEKYDIVIDRYVYMYLTKVLRLIHGFKKNKDMPKNKLAREIFIEESKEKYEENKQKEFKSQLFPLISTMVNIEGFPKDDQTVFDMNIFAFMDSVKRIGKIRNSQVLLQSGYSGFGVDLKKIDKKDLDYMGELE